MMDMWRALALHQEDRKGKQADTLVDFRAGWQMCESSQSATIKEWRTFLLKPYPESRRHRIGEKTCGYNCPACEYEAERASLLERSKQ